MTVKLKTVLHGAKHVGFKDLDDEYYQVFGVWHGGPTLNFYMTCNEPNEVVELPSKTIEPSETGEIPIDAVRRAIADY